MKKNSADNDKNRSNSGYLQEKFFHHFKALGVLLQFFR